MAATNINRVIITGNLTADPELRSLPHKPFRARDLYDPHRHISEIRVKTRDFR